MTNPCRDARAQWRVIALVGIFLAFHTQRPVAFEIVTLAPRADSPALSVKIRDGLLSVEAKEQSWIEVLKEMRQQTGIFFHLSSPLEGLVTISFKDLPAERALERLFGPDKNFMFLYHAADPKSASSALPAEVWVLGRGAEKFFDTADDKGTRAPEATEETNDPGQEGEKEDSGELLAALEALKVDDPALRVQALSFLDQSGKADERTLLSALEEALADEDASVRGQAVQILANRGEPEVMKYLWQALHDQDLSIRTVLIESVVPQGQGLTLLQTALSDADETVRSIATLRLKQGGASGR